MTNPIMDFCNRIITGVGGLHDYERYELATPTVDRDVATAVWVIKALANPDCEGSQEMVDAIMERRKALQEAS